MATPFLRILLAESGVTETGLTLRSLCAESGKRLELRFVSDRNKIERALHEFAPDACFLALSLLQPDPFSAIRRISNSAPLVPLILFALPADKACAEQCLRMGATDFVMEGYMDVRTLDRVLTTAIRGPVSISPATASLNPLTGLLDFSGLCRQASLREGQPACSGSQTVFFIRVDSTDAHELTNSDSLFSQAIQTLAHRLQNCVRRTDLLAYVAPGRFLLVIQDDSEACLHSLRQRLSLSLLRFQQAHGSRFSLNFNSANWPVNSPCSFKEFLRAEIAAAAPPPLPYSRPAPAHPSGFAPGAQP